MKKITLFSFAVLLLAACGSNSGEKISGAGATFPQPFYNIVFKKFAESTSNRVNYGAIGSGAGIRNLQDKTVDFGASDAFMSDDEIKEIGTDVIHIPTAMGAVVLSYNLPGVDGLKLTASIISDIYRGKITNWQDEKIKALNPDLSLPNQAITPVYRSDGSGTTFVFSDYMSKADSVWNEEIGTGKALKMPNNVGVASKGNPGVAGVVKETLGSIGYIGSEYALALALPTALIQNNAGNFVAPDEKSISASAETDIPNDTRVMITNSANPEAYPISTFTWIIVYKEQSYNNRSEAKAKALVGLLNFIIGEEGQSIASKTHYAPLSASVVEKTKANIASMTFNGKAINVEADTKK